MIDPGISDLFFNLDFADCKIMDKDRFVSFDDAKVLSAAQWFCGTLGRSTGVEVDARELVANFYARV